MTSFVSSLLFQPFVKLTWNHDLFTVFQCPDSIVNEGYTIICPVRSHFCLHIMHVRMCVLTHTLLCMWRKILHRNMFPSIIIFTLKMGLSVIVSSFCSFVFSVFPQYASVACVIKNYFRKPFSSFVYNTWHPPTGVVNGNLFKWLIWNGTYFWKMLGQLSHLSYFRKKDEQETPKEQVKIC